MDRNVLKRVGVALAVVVAGIVISFGLSEAVRWYSDFPARATYYMLVLGLPALCGALFIIPFSVINYRLEMSQRAMKRLAETDVLTDLRNRRGFFEQALALLERARAADQPVSLLMVDIDRFKAVNDAHGHAAGDQLLRFVSAHIRTLVAETRAAETVAGRVGGEEFAILLRDVDPSAGTALADRLCDFVRASRTAFGDLEIGATLSIGVASGRGVSDIDAFLRVADHAVYQAKREGRDRWVYSAGQREEPAGNTVRTGARAA